MSSLNTIAFLQQIQEECSMWTNLNATEDNWNNHATFRGLCMSIVSSLNDMLSNDLLGAGSGSISNSDLESVSTFQCNNLLYLHIWKNPLESAKDKSAQIVNSRAQSILGQISCLGSLIGEPHHMSTYGWPNSLCVTSLNNGHYTTIKSSKDNHPHAWLNNQSWCPWINTTNTCSACGQILNSGNKYIALRTYSN